MADDVGIIDANGVKVPVLTDEIVSRNGAALPADAATGRQPQAQVIKIAFGADSTADDVTAATRFPVQPPRLTRVASGAATVTGVSAIVIAANATRQQVSVFNLSSVRLWLGFGESAVVGHGGYIDPGGVVEEPTPDEIRAMTGDGSTVVGGLSFIEWGPA